MIKRIAAITFIFVCTAFAWAVLGATIFQRTYDSGLTSNNRVTSTWGAPQNQSPPAASFSEEVPTKQVTNENGKQSPQITIETVVTPLPLESSQIKVDLNLEHRQKGLLWYSTYKVAFDGTYAFHNPSDKDRTVTFKLDFPTSQAIYDDLVFTVDDVPIILQSEKNSASGTAKIAAGKTARLQVGYKSQGLNDWRYSFGPGATGTPSDAGDYSREAMGVTQVRDFSLKMTTNFKDIDFPDNTLSPTAKNESGERLGAGMELQESCLGLSDRDDHA